MYQQKLLQILLMVMMFQFRILFGVVLTWEDWHSLAERLKSVNTKFEIAPCIRFQGKVGEQATMFFKDPENNALEFKAFQDMNQLFAK